MYIEEHGKKVYVGKEALDFISKKLREGRKLHYKTTFQDLPISVENRKGSIRKGENDDGTEWKTKHKNPYGYIRGTEGADGDHVDVFVGPKEDAAYAYVIHIKKLKTGKYDEDKVMLGFDSKDAALNCFRQHYDDPKKFYLGMDTIPMWKFRNKVFIKKETSRKLVASRGGSPTTTTYDHGQQVIAPIAMVARFYSDVLGSLKTHEQIEAFPEMESPDTIPAPLKKKHVHEAVDMFGEKGPYGDSLGTDQKMKKSILGHHQDVMQDPEVREGGKGSGPHKGDAVDVMSHHAAQIPKQVWIERAGGEYRGKQEHPAGGHLHYFNDPKTGTTLAMHGDNIRSEHDVKDHMLKSRKEFERSRDEGIARKKGHEAEEHGVKGMKWGIRHARKDASSEKHPVTGQPKSAGKRAIVKQTPNRTLSQMGGDVQQGNAVAAKLNAQNQQKTQQGQSVNPKDAHQELLNHMMKELGWKAVGALARVAGVGGAFDSVKSILESPTTLQKVLVKTDKQGNHSMTPAKSATNKKARTSVRESGFSQRLGSFLREAKKKVYYARSLQRYGSNREARDLEDVQEAYPDRNITFPRTRRHAELGMGYFHKKIDKAKEVVITGIHRHKVTAGVASEARHALKKGIPVHFLRNGKLRTVEAIENIEGGKPGGHYARVIFAKRKKKK